MTDHKHECPPIEGKDYLGTWYSKHQDGYRAPEVVRALECAELTMPDERKRPEDFGAREEEVSRRDAEGNLTVWGARDVLLHLVDDALRDAWAAGADSLDHIRAGYARRFNAALDDLEDAVLRTHDDFGCPSNLACGIVGKKDRFVCRACRELRG